MDHKVTNFVEVLFSVVSNNNMHTGFFESVVLIEFYLTVLDESHQVNQALINYKVALILSTE
jgi:hypothetical protein